MMGGYGSSMMGFGLLGWIINIVVIGLVVYFSVTFALRNYFNQNK
ncbi:hypothetical protein [Saliterribacillus persicus]|uniref:Uncharacterized protein n=1 Tax=Saliterribacillus persicus TaxID=930114 RepID=A0A368Y4E6_9BACI|nr:hypothetical protein [Saliterribacillus persicus]RCW74975.1 hypothetical protein DFR57_103272 [Saliterribacillus persicus]